jgi:putative alpha-1,2-mannosidase
MQESWNYFLVVIHDFLGYILVVGSRERMAWSIWNFCGFFFIC